MFGHLFRYIFESESTLSYLEHEISKRRVGETCDISRTMISKINIRRSTNFYIEYILDELYNFILRIQK